MDQKIATALSCVVTGNQYDISKIIEVIKLQQNFTPPQYKFFMITVDRLKKLISVDENTKINDLMYQKNPEIKNFLSLSTKQLKLIISKFDTIYVDISKHMISIDDRDYLISYIYFLENQIQRRLLYRLFLQSVKNNDTTMIKFLINEPSLLLQQKINSFFDHDTACLYMEYIIDCDCALAFWFTTKKRGPEFRPKCLNSRAPI